MMRISYLGDERFGIRHPLMNGFLTTTSQSGSLPSVNVVPMGKGRTNLSKEPVVVLSIPHRGAASLREGLMV